MKSITIKKLFFKYPSSNSYLFEDLSFELSSGINGIVGKNGCGKSTFLEILAGNLLDYEGEINFKGSLYYCPQSSSKKPDLLEEFFVSFSKRSFLLKDFLKIDESFCERWHELSLGERKRVEVAVALFSERDLILFDEPTNYLDTTSKDLIIQAIKNFSTMVVLVSHDREVLDLLCDNTLFLDRAKMSFHCGFTKALKELESRENFLLKENSKKKEDLKKLTNTIQQRQIAVEQSSKRLSKKGLSSKDRDKKEKINLAKLTGKDKKESRSLKNLNGKKDLLEKSLHYVKIEEKKELIFPYEERKKVFPLTFSSRLFALESVTIEKGDKIFISGKNGSGKSTFLQELVSSIDRDCFFLPQEFSKEEKKTHIKEFLVMDNREKGELLSFVKLLFSDPKAYLDTASLSFGEMKKLVIAKELQKENTLLILDEPTNHLDIYALETLQKALAHFQGAVVFVTHDKYLERIKTKELEVIKKKNERVVVEKEC